MPFSILGLWEKMWPFIYQNVFICIYYIYTKVFILIKYTEKIYTQSKIEPSKCVIIDMKITKNSGNWGFTTLLGTQLFPQNIPSSLP